MVEGRREIQKGEEIRKGERGEGHFRVFGETHLPAMVEMIDHRAKTSRGFAGERADQILIRRAFFEQSFFGTWRNTVAGMG